MPKQKDITRYVHNGKTLYVEDAKSQTHYTFDHNWGAYLRLRKSRPSIVVIYDSLQIMRDELEKKGIAI